MENKYCTIFLLILMPFGVFSQQTLDIGAALGTTSYIGDINQKQLFYRPNIAFEGMARFNVDARYAVRFSLLFGSLEGADADFENDYQQKRNASFSTPFTELGVVGEFNFVPYSNPVNWSTTAHSLYGVLGATYTSASSTGSSIAIPIGLGYKYNIGKRFALEAEWTFRKTLIDNLDKVEDPHELEQTTPLFNNDWYYFAGVRLSYSLVRFNEKCRTFEKTRFR